ncbi:hypothetical protein BD769DRAFT_1383646 [Suillus cothurnatus]|nr:hypothetical protein BD769DRAFT_1383646 [Suillus cothurnatus]
MAWTFAGLSRLFGSDGAFIVGGFRSANVRNPHSLPTVEWSARGHPMFHIIPCACLQGMETQEDEPHLQSVLMVSNELYGSQAIADGIDHLIAHDHAVQTVYTESVQLAESVARDAAEMWKLRVANGMPHNYIDAVEWRTSLKWPVWDEVRAKVWDKVWDTAGLSAPPSGVKRFLYPSLFLNLAHGTKANAQRTGIETGWRGDGQAGKCPGMAVRNIDRCLNSARCAVVSQTLA